LPNTYRIHPALGIARVGDSPDEYFVGPEAPGVPPSLNPPDAPHDPNAGYKDDQGRIKRQGARFRIYEYTLDDMGVTTQVREITAADAQIEWEVYLANRKASAPRFFDGGWRNEGVDNRSKLIIDAGPQKISGVRQDTKPLQGIFMDAVSVRLGDLLTDSAGRLIVLGGLGKSQFLSPDDEERHIDNFADNDGWCDDTSDGPVRATIRLNGSTGTVEADPAWVVVAPPDFAPSIENVVTLYDVVYNMMAKFDPSLAISDVTKVSFTRDIYPILRRVSNMHWVSAFAALGHHPGSGLGPPPFTHFISHVPRLSDNSQRTEGMRATIFRKIRTPKELRNLKGKGGDMPKLPTGAGRRSTLSLTEQQYLRMEKWAQGEFDSDWPEDGEPPTPLPLDELPDMERPHALVRAALEACVGGGFFPGIEVGRIMLEEAAYDRNRPFRVNALLCPGTLTQRMAVPWQADFLLCRSEDDRDPDNLPDRDWWPGQRPSQVFRGQSQERIEWTPPEWNFLSMVDDWSKLGFVVEKMSAGQVEYVEDERSLNLQ
jgi:hypothetical protein